MNSSAAKALISAQLNIPERIFKTLSPLGQIDEAFMRQAIARFAVME
jgi:hypothetical protein